MAFGEPPQWDDISDEEIVEEIEEYGAEQLISEDDEDIDSVGEDIVEEFSPEELELIRKAYLRAIKNKQFDLALEEIQKIPETYFNDQDAWSYRLLSIFNEVEIDLANQSEMLFGDDELDKSTKLAVDRFYREAQTSLLNGETELAKDLLIQSVYLHRRGYRSKKLLSLALGLPSGAYKIENIEDKYWTLQKHYFYTGNYDDAIIALRTLSIIDSKNPEVYELLGSNYYAMADFKEAINAWTTALYMDPNNQSIKRAIDRSKKMLEKEKEESQERRAARKVRESQDTEDTPKSAESADTQLLRVAKTQTDAFSYAQQLRDKGFTPIIDELSDGRWAVKVPKLQLTNKESK